MKTKQTNFQKACDGINTSEVRHDGGLVGLGDKEQRCVISNQVNLKRCSMIKERGY